MGIVALPAQSQTVCRLGLDELRMGRADRYRRQSETGRRYACGGNNLVQRHRPRGRRGCLLRQEPSGVQGQKRGCQQYRGAESGRFFHHFREPPASNIHESVPVFHKG